jgi:hypothetical protein
MFADPRCRTVTSTVDLMKEFQKRVAAFVFPWGHNPTDTSPEAK